MNDELLKELGRTETVKDAEAAYQQIYNSTRKLEIALRRARLDERRQTAEIELFLDDLRTITGLGADSKLFWKIASLTIARRLARRHLLANEFHSSLGGWPDDGDGLEDF
jgi:hypothetical protein